MPQNASCFSVSSADEKMKKKPKVGKSKTNKELQAGKRKKNDQENQDKQK